MVTPLARSRSKTVRIVIAAFFLVGIGAYIGVHRNELDSLSHALRSGRWSWLLVAAVLEAFYFLDEGFYFSRAFRLTGTRIPALSVTPVLLGAQTLSVIVPSEFLADQSLFFSFAKRRGQSPTQVALGVSLAEISEFFSFMAILIVGFSLLGVHRDVQHFEVAAGYFVSLLCLLLAALAAFLLWKPQAITHILTTLQDAWNRFCRITGRSWRLSQDWAEQMSLRMTEGIAIARRNPRGLGQLFLLALVGHGFRIVCLFAVFQAFGLSVALWKITTAYAVGTLVWIASPIPGGIGLVEGAYSLVFVSLGIMPSAAATLALVYRGVTFWLPLGAGIVALRFVSRHGDVSQTRP
jgi:uncharacterized protein (TIRG00374 family)